MMEAENTFLSSSYDSRSLKMMQPSLPLHKKFTDKKKCFYKKNSQLLSANPSNRFTEIQTYLILFLV